MPISGSCSASYSDCPPSPFPRSSVPFHRVSRFISHGCAELRLAVVSPFVDMQHGTERVLAELLERLASKHQAEIRLYSQHVTNLPVISADRASTDSNKAGKILWRKVSLIPGPHLFQFLWWYFANRFARWRDARLYGLQHDLLYSPGINAADCDAITVHIVFHAFYEKVREDLRFLGRSPLRWPRTAHRILYYRLIMALERRIYRNPSIVLSAVSQLVAVQLERFFGRPDVFVIRNAVDMKVFNSKARLARR